MLTKITDAALAANYRSLRNQMRPIHNELTRRGFVVREKHGHGFVPVTGFENIIISKSTVVKL